MCACVCGASLRASVKGGICLGGGGICVLQRVSHKTLGGGICLGGGGISAGNCSERLIFANNRFSKSCNLLANDGFSQKNDLRDPW